MNTQQVEDKLGGKRFAVSMWNGFEVAFQRVTTGRHDLKTLKAYVEERAAAEEQGLRRAGKERVLGVGLGVFLLSFFFIAMCALCWAGALLPQERGEQWIFNVVGTLGFGVVACVLFLADERPEYASEERAEREHDDNLIGLIVVAGLLACAAAFGLGAVLCYHVCAPVEAPLVQKRPAGDRQGLFDASGQCVASRPAFTA